GVDAVAHLRLAGVGEDAAVAKRSRPELHAAPIPRHHPAAGDEPGGLRTGLGEGVEASDLDSVDVRAEGRVDRRLRVPWSEEGHRRSEEHTSELQSRVDLVCRLLL